MTAHLEDAFEESRFPKRSSKLKAFLFPFGHLRLEFLIMPLVVYSTMPKGIFYVMMNISLDGFPFIFIPGDFIAHPYLLLF